MHVLQGRDGGRVFYKFDRDGDGNVTHEEFLSAVRDFNIPYTEEQAKRLIHLIDENNDGNIEYHELASKLFDEVSGK